MAAPPTPTSDPLIGRTIGGCVLARRAGSGALSAVYRAKRTADGLPVAIKMLTSLAAQDAENVLRHQREIELGQKIKHPNIATIMGGGCDNGIHYLVMELVEGASMEAVIQARGKLPWREAAHLIAQVGKALEHLQGHGIIHRDIKPANILLTPGGVAKLIDLGFAKPGEAADGAGMTMVGTAMGSPAYMPPEQVLDARSVSHRADVYGLGATFFHAVTGKTPFSGKNYHEVMNKVVRDPVPDPRTLVPDLSPAIAELILWAMAKNPDARPEHAASFVQELQLCAGDPSNVARIRSLRRKRSGVLLLVGVVVAALVVTGILAWVLLRR